MKIKCKTYNLTDVELVALSNKRKIMEELLRPRFRGDMGMIERLSIVDRVISEGNFLTSSKHDLQGVSVVLGDAFVNEIGFHWVTVDDFHGKEFAIRYKKSSIILYPRKLVAKLVDERPDVDAVRLFHNVSEHVHGLLNDDPDPLRSQYGIVHPLLKAA
jgi:hypothetical protein